MPPYKVLRHRKENLKKCSLTGLETREDFEFYAYPRKGSIDLSGYFILSLDGSILTRKDADKGVMLVDSTWRYSEKMLDFLLKGQIVEQRRLPADFVTAYPRRQDDCVDPSAGLASIEALYITCGILGRDTKGLLDHYYFAEAFLELNREAFKKYF
ncbi:MAG: DUF367 domain-containing protein [Chlamydiales bacterium]|nr:DUF367 domain-containing protein [Chlamydiales bacterium]